MIAPATIAEVKERADLVAVVQEAGVALRRRGRAHLGLCPFHSEKTPSFSVNPERNYFHCFGCHKQGGPIDFLIETAGMTFPDAVRDLAGRFGIRVEEDSVPKDRAVAAQEQREREDIFAVNELAAVFYERALWGERPARGAGYAHEELDNRGLGARPGEEGPVGAALAAFRVGYAPAAWGALAAYLERCKRPLALAARAGLLLESKTKPGRYYDRFRHRLMFPVQDHLGRVVAFSGRTLPEPLPEHFDAPSFRPDEEPAKYLNSPETPAYRKGETLFGLWQAREAVRARGEAVLVEGNFDVVALHARGILHAVAPLGTAFTEAQAKLLRRFTPRVVVAFDGDKAGKKATWEARLPVQAGRLEARVALLPASADPDSLVRRGGAAAFEDLLSHAQDLRQHLFRVLLSGTEGGPAAQGRRTQAAIELLGEVRDPVERAQWRTFVDRLASETVVNGRAPKDLRDLEMAVRKAMQPQEQNPVAEAPLADPLGFDVVGAVLDAPSILTRADVAAVVDLLDGDLAAAARAAALLSVESVLAETPAALRTRVERRLGAPQHGNDDAAVGAVLACGARLRARRGRGEAERLRREIELAESAGEEASVEALCEQLAALLAAQR